ncbi:MAG: dienelactone hydrolase family protein [Candidatus Eremiobacteraeota bacterium]|nr:dienelactone hydrolase family protein [Candidatus Eremiobacteraeota bacterium]
MTITEREENVSLDGGSSAMRTLIVKPTSGARFPTLVLYSDIFQLTPSTRRTIARFAGHGFLVAAPEIYHRLEPAGTALEFDDAGRTRGLSDASRSSVAAWDADLRALLEYLKRHEDVDRTRIGALGFCLGGHLAFRAAFSGDVKATACFYPTGVEDGKLGSEPDCKSLSRVGEIRGEMLLVFGTHDPHVSFESRAKIASALHEAEVAFRLVEYDAEHAFMRDEGARYDPAATDAAFLEALTFFRSVFT